MGYRYYDWQCTVCGIVLDHLTWVSSGETPHNRAPLDCDPCGATTVHERRISLPAPYRGEADWHPMVAGGSFDTVGQAPTRALPDPPPGAMGDGAALREHFRSPEFRDAKAQRAEQTKHNALKRRRTALAGEGARFNLRRPEDRLPGDPKL